jgi:hypothetical protein
MVHQARKTGARIYASPSPAIFDPSRGSLTMKSETDRGVDVDIVLCIIDVQDGVKHENLEVDPDHYI